MNTAQKFDNLLTCLIGANELARMRRKQKRKAKEARAWQEVYNWVDDGCQPEFQEGMREQ